MTSQDLPLILSFLGGSISSSIADVCTFPMDMLKTRMQLGGTQGMVKYTSMRHCITHTYETYGFTGFYKGLSAALIRQVIYSGIRITIYDQVKLLIGDEASSGSKWSRFLIGGLSGGVSSFLATPLDVIKIRIINDPFGQKYSGFLDTLSKTYQRDGFIKGFYKGSSPNVYRALLVNAAELGTYDNAKSLLTEHLKMRDDSIVTRFWASVIAGLVAAVVTSPVDVVKTRYMTMSKEADGKVLFSSPFDCLKKIVKGEGFWALYNGFLFLWLRLGPWCVVMFLTWDLYKDNVGKEYSKYKNKGVN